MTGTMKTRGALIAAQALVVVVLVIGLFSRSPEGGAPPAPRDAVLAAAFERISLLVRPL